MQVFVKSLGLAVLVSLFSMLIPVIPLAAEESRDRGGYYDMGIFAYESEQYLQAEHYFKIAWRNNYQDPHLNHYLGRTYLQLRRNRSASVYLDLAHAVQPDLPGLAYDMALLNHRLGNYAEALALYKKSLTDDPDNAQAVYHAGMCAFSLNRFEDAIRFFQQADAMNPSLTGSAAFYSGLSYYRLNRYQQATEQFQRAGSTADSRALRKKAAEWLAVVDRETREIKPYLLHLRIGARYDDNVRLTTDDLDEWLQIDKDNRDVALAAFLSGRYHLLHRENWRLGIGYSHYHTRHQTLDEYDLIGSIGDFFVEYHRFPIIIGLEYRPSYYWLDTDSYLMRHQFGPHFTWQITTETYATILYYHKRNDYFSGRERDGHADEVRLSIDYRLPENDGILRWSIGGEINQADQAYNDYYSIATRLGVTWRVSKKARLGLSSGFDFREYAEPDPIFVCTRKDRRYSGTVSLERNVFYDWLGLALFYDVDINHSNNKYYGYSRNRVTVAVTANLY